MRVLPLTLRKLDNINRERTSHLVLSNDLIGLCNFVMTCKLCKNKAKLVRSHIIQEAFHRIMAQGEPTAVKLFPRSKKEFPKKRPKGLYDDNLVCEPCERRFAPYDNYGYKFLTDEAIEKGYSPQGLGLDARFIDNFDYSKLKLYFLSTLWRASNTTNDFFHAVSVGSIFNKQLIQMIIDGSPGKPEEFSVIVSEFKEDNAKLAYPTPYKFKFGDRTFYRLFLGGFAVDIKVDSRPCNYKYQPIILAPDQPLIILKYSFKDSYDYSQLFKRFGDH